MSENIFTPHTRSILMRLLRRNSMAALELHQRTGGGAMEGEGGGPLPGPLLPEGGSPEGKAKESEGGGAGDKHDRDVVALRTGGWGWVVGWCSPAATAAF